MSTTLFLNLSLMCAFSIVLLYVHLLYVQAKEAKNNKWPHPFKNTKAGLHVQPSKKELFYNSAMESIKSCKTKDQLSVSCALLMDFKMLYGRCDKYDELHAEYLGKLLAFTEYKTPDRSQQKRFSR